MGKKSGEIYAVLVQSKRNLNGKGRKQKKGITIISSRGITVPELLHHARMEWAAESMHWLLDVHFSEDYRRIVNRTIQQNLNMLRK